MNTDFTNENDTLPKVGYRFHWHLKALLQFIAGVRQPYALMACTSIDRSCLFNRIANSFEEVF